MSHPTSKPGDLLPEPNPAPKKRVGGPAYHKNPLCPCQGCRARRREAQAFALGGRDGGLPNATERFTPEVGLLRADGTPAKTSNDFGDRSARARVASWLAARAENPQVQYPEVAKKLGIAVNTLKSHIYTARKAGWLSFDDPLDKIEFEIIPKTLDNLNAFLDAKDKQVTIEVAKGTIFKTYQQEKGISDAPQTILALKIEMPDGDTKIMSGTIVGAPRRT